MQCEFVPYLAITGADKAVEFYSAVFETTPRNLLTMPDGRIMHCEFQTDSGRFFVSEELPEHGGTPSPARLGTTSVAIHLYVDNCDHVIKQMVAHGAELMMEPDDMFWGERFGRVRDPFGHEWGITTVIRDLSPAEIQSAVDQMFQKNSEN